MRDTMIRQQHEAVTTPLDDMHHLFNKTPWLEDMIGRANEILNALLRLQKHQLAAQEEKRQSIYYYSPSGTFYVCTLLYVRETREEPNALFSLFSLSDYWE